MNKILKVLGVIFLVIIVLVCCVMCSGSDDKTDKVKNEPQYMTNGEEAAENCFKDGTLLLDDIKITITDYKVVPANTGDNYREDPIIVFFYDITNLEPEDSDTTVYVGDFWEYFDAVQDNDSDTINELDLATYSEDGYDEMLKVKKGGTAHGMQGYVLTDTTTPVTLVSKDLFSFGEQVYNLTSK